MPPERVAEGWKWVLGQLEYQRNQIAEEIRHYPRPIPACDLQFNFLLEQRAALVQELEQVRQLTEESLYSPEPFRLLEAFLRSSNCLNEEAKQRITASWNEGPSEPRT